MRTRATCTCTRHMRACHRYNAHLATSLIQHAPMHNAYVQAHGTPRYQAATNAEAAERACRSAKERRLLAALHRAEVDAAAWRDAAEERAHSRRERRGLAVARA